MTTKRATGSYYTPTSISEFIVKRVLNKHQGIQLKILEPSAGDGVFIRSVFKSDLFEHKISKVTAIELSPRECGKIRELNNSKVLTVLCEDFLKYQSQFKKEQFDIVFGNPPYIKKNLLTPDQIASCQKIHAGFSELSKSAVKNIWSAFLVRSISLLKRDGILSFVLPAELLQVNFTAELRKLLTDEFQRVEIFTFNELLFKECKGQDTLVLIAEKNSETPGLFFHNVVDVVELDKDEFSFISKNSSETSKWTTHCLTQPEIELLDSLKSNLKTVDQFCKSKAGIVTGANNYFILNQQDVNLYALQKYSKPIIQKGAVVTSPIKFDQQNFNQLVRNQSPCFLIDLNHAKINSKSKINNYLLLGKSKQIDKRYKTQLRDNWYEVPNIATAGQGLFFKRCHDVPKFIINEANVLATDSAYLVNPKENIDINSLVLSFYNSLTLIFAEINGRFYGGGVLELTPNEFKKLPLPYFKFSEVEYLKFLKLFQSEKDFDSNIKKLDTLILKSVIPTITDSEIELLVLIKQKLISRRKRL
ncbi:MAG: N-6 DNA methylase [Methylophilaceae bacterium]